jgi:hypothetical protein
MIPQSGKQMNETRIWRPNCFTPEEWDRFSREEQILWWKNESAEGEKNQSPSVMHPKRSISLFQTGVITDHEFPIFVFRNLTRENIPELLAECPDELRLELDRFVAEYPSVDVPEEKLPRIFHMGSYFPWVTEEEIEESARDLTLRIRKGVEIYREYRSRDQ